MNDDETASRERTAFPTSAGHYIAYDIQFRERETDKWRSLRSKAVNDGKFFVPGDKCCAGINYTLDFSSYEQAMAHAWRIKAQAVYDMEPLQVRLVPYEVSYSCQAYVMEDKAELLVGEHDELS